MKLRGVALILLIVTGCGGSGVETDEAADGADLFESTVLAGQAGCVTCHSVVPDRVLVGPSLAGVGERASQRLAGMSAEMYLRESIVDPDAFLVDGFAPGRMPGVWGDVLTDEEVTAIVDYLLELK